MRSKCKGPTPCPLSTVAFRVIQSAPKEKKGITLEWIFKTSIAFMNWLESIFELPDLGSSKESQLNLSLKWMSTGPTEQNASVIDFPIESFTISWSLQTLERNRYGLASELCVLALQVHIDWGYISLLLQSVCGIVLHTLYPLQHGLVVMMVGVYERAEVHSPTRRIESAPI